MYPSKIIPYFYHLTVVKYLFLNYFSEIINYTIITMNINEKPKMLLCHFISVV